MNNYPHLSSSLEIKLKSVGGGNCTYLTWNQDRVFQATIVIVMTLHNQENSLKNALESALHQITETKFAVLLLDDNSTDQWQVSIQHLLTHPKLVIAKGKAGTAWKARNLAHKIAKEYFDIYKWICRMDADDQFASNLAIQQIYTAMQNRKSDALWILPGNKLKVDDQLIPRINFPNPNLSQPSVLLEQLNRLKDGEETAELPSCNIWIHRNLRIWYPEIESAEDHWLVAKILVYYGSQGLILPNLLHATYSLSGETTKDNRNTGEFHRSRENLYYAVKYWIQNRITDPSHPICLGYGGEGMVWFEDNLIKKNFYPSSLSEEQVQWLKTHIPSNHANIISPQWKKIKGTWQAHTPFFQSSPVESPTRVSISNFIQFMLKHRIVCVNIARKNFRNRKGELCFIDIGQHIYPFEIRYFRDICARLYLLFIQGYSDTELNEITLKIRNNIPELLKIEGFEDFFQRELLLFFNSHRFLRKPFRNVPPQFHFPNITLLIKACAMEYDILEAALHHILHQIRHFETYYETILLIDSKETNFLREYQKPDLQKIITIAQKCKQLGLIDRILISPSPKTNQEGIHRIQHDIQDLYHRWFNCSSHSTHTSENVPLFSQLWGFEQITTRYVLQLDLDVLIHRNDYHYNVIEDMLEALQEEKIFSVGFNICQNPFEKFKRYDAPVGKYVPEVRLGLLDLKRIKAMRPYPNITVKGQLKYSWYRSIEKYQQKSAWRSLRGGNPQIFYIHPPNKYKMKPEFLSRVQDLVEQSHIPSIQQLQWDLVGSPQEWKYPHRNEEIILVVHIKEPNKHWVRGCLTSIFDQQPSNWGLIIINSTRNLKFRYWLEDLIFPWYKRITLLQSRQMESLKEIDQSLILDLVTNLEAFLIPLAPTEVLMRKEALSIIADNITTQTKVIACGTFHYYAPLVGSAVPLSEGTFSQKDLNQMIEDGVIRGGKIEELSLLFQIQEGYDPPNISEKLVQLSKQEIVYIPEYLILNSSKTFSYSASKTEGRTLRPSIYLPNIKRIEIDLTYQCNLRCPGCCRSCAQAPEKLHISIDQIHQFLRETETRNIHWESVHLLGGEPTLHPHFLEIVMLLTEWFEKNSLDTDLKVISNGYGDYVQKQLNHIPQRWLYQTSFKECSKNEYFEPFNLAPIDLPEWQSEDFKKGCWITQDSGIGLTPLGYFHCAIAGGIERIMHLGKGLSSLPYHPWELLDMMHTYCRYCGHFLNDFFHSRQEQLKLEISPNKMSKSWRMAYKKWKKHKEDRNKRRSLKQE